VITEILLMDFKCFDDKRLKCAPLTVMTGTNSVGKSSALQALCLARSACLQSLRGSTIVPLNGPLGLNLGQFQDILRSSLDTDDEDILIGITEDGEEYTLVLNGQESRFADFQFSGDSLPSSLKKEGFGQFVFLASERLGPRSSSPIQSVPKDQLTLDPRGELIADILYQCERDEILQELEHPSAPDQRLLKQVEAWLGSFVPGVEIRVDPANDLDLASLKFLRTGISSEWERPSNTGFGVSYCLPIIIAGLTAKFGAILIIESPEAHLHPRAQSAMGDFLGRVAASGVQVFIETHSDHILNGIRRAVIAEMHPLSREDVIINHLRIAEGELVNEEIRITETGSLSARPTEFFDQTEIDLGAIVKSRAPTRS